jgi:hypothetical protein
MKPSRSLLVCITILSIFIAACSGWPAVDPASATLVSPSPTMPPTLLPPSPTVTPPPALASADLMRGYIAALDALKTDKLVAYYSKDVAVHDADSGSITFNISTVNTAFRSYLANGTFLWKLNSFFVSADGRFAATLGSFSEKDGTGKFVPKPSVSLFELKDGKIVWEYDYYGGAHSETLSLEDIPASANQPAPASTVNQTQVLVSRWEEAYNSRDSAAYLSAYTDQAKVTEVIAPEWRVLDRVALEQDVATKFGAEKFKSRLEAFFVSADSRFAAIQGVYKDEKTVNIPMVIILEVEDGKIIWQNNYLGYTAATK